MKKLKYAIILLIILILIISAILLMFRNTSNNGGSQEVPEISYIPLEKEENISSFLLANELVSNWFSYISQKDDRIDNREAAFSLLDEKYIDNNKITKDNIFIFFNQYSNYKNYSSKDMYTRQINNREDYTNFFVYIEGIVRTEEGNSDIYILMKQDLSNQTYSIQFLTESEYKKYISNDQIEVTKFEINNKEYNKLYTKTVSDYELCLTHMNDYSNIVKSNLNEAYLLINEEYRNKRFGTFEKFKEYVDNNEEFFKNGSFIEYLVEYFEDYDQYYCKDINDNMFIFREKYPMQYKVILDTYTLDLPEFLEQYNNTNNQGKTALNIQKFFQAINAKDYSYAYSKLADSFKNNYFKTEEEFENYMKNTFFNYNKVEYVNFSVEGNVNVYSLIITDQTGENINKLSVNIIMQLNEGTDFIMSFGS